MKNIARSYFDMGADIVVLNEKKEPLIKWEKWQKQRQTLEEFNGLPWNKAVLFAVICGTKLANGLYFGAIDIDIKKVTPETIVKGKEFEETLKVVTQTEETPSKGKHFIYYSKKPIRTENKAHDFCGVEVLGERKLVIMAPSKGYNRLNDNLPNTVGSLNEFVDSQLKRIGYKGKLRNGVAKSTDNISKFKGTKHKIRPCFLELMKREHLEHPQKLALVVEFLHAGSTQTEIEVLFAEHRSWEGPEYKVEKTRKQIESAKPYQRFSCDLLEEDGVCTGYENCESREEKHDFMDIDDKGNMRFNPVKFAKYLMKDWHFKTTHDNETLYVYDWEKGIYGDWGKVFIKQQMAKELDEGNRARYVADVVHHIHGSTYFERQHNPLGKVAVENGYLDVRTRELTPYTPELFIETKIPLKYDPTAKCPKCKKFIREVVGKKQEPIIQEILGYSLYKALPYHKAIMLIGEGANGKSTLLHLIEKFLGSENVSHTSLQALCSSRFSTAELYGKLANICDDLPSTALKQTSMFKMLTGGYRVEGQKKFKNPFDFANYAKLIFSANKIPDSKDDTTAFWRRWIIIACNNLFMGETCNPKILEEISTPKEMSGLLNYALEGLRRLLKKGVFEDIEAVREQWTKSSNSAKYFIDEMLEYDPKTTAIIPVVNLYRTFVLFCTSYKISSMTQRQFTVNLKQYLPEAKKVTVAWQGKQTKCWRHIKEKEPTDKEQQKLVETPTEPTDSALNHKNTIKKQLNTVDSKKLGLPRLSKESVGSVEKSEAIMCPLCNGLLPRDLSGTVEWERKIVHKQCHADLIAGRIKP